jgi:hypothetical protein
MLRHFGRCKRAHGRLAHDAGTRPIGPDVIPRRRLRLASPIGDARGRSVAARHTQTRRMSQPLGRLAVFQTPGRLAEIAGRVEVG